MECVFCKIVARELPELVVYEDAHALAFLDKEQAVSGHTLVVPKTHYESIFDILPEELNHLSSAVKKTAELLRERLGCDGINVLNANGKAAQQSVSHLHFHVLPRWEHDGVDAWLKKESTNVMDRDALYRKIRGD
jgi:histidine triad (HIT) family protein